MKRLAVLLATASILLFAFGLVSRSNPVTAQSGETRTFLPFMSRNPTPWPRPLYRLAPTVGRSAGGTSYEDAVPTDVHVSEVWLSTGSFIEGVQFWYLHPDGLAYTSGPHGGWGGSLHRIVFGEDEYIVALNGKSGVFMDSLSIVTNKRTFGPYGGSGGDTDFSIAAPAGNEIVGLFGRAGGLLDYTGALARWRMSMPPGTPATTRTIIRLTPTAGLDNSALLYQDTVPDDGRVAEVWVHSDSMVQSFQFWYLRSDGTLYSPGQRGFFSKGDLHKLILDADEYITAMSLNSGEFMDAVTIMTNKRVFGPWGGTGGSPTDIVAPSGYEICGLYGSYSLGINMTGGLARQRR